MEFVKVRYRGSADVGLSGTMRVPKDMWDRKPADQTSTEEIDEFIADNADFLNALDGFGEVEIDFVSKVE